MPLEKDSIRFKHFFDKESRKRHENFDILESVSATFSSMYSLYKDKIFLNNPEIENHNLFKTLKRILQEPKNLQEEKDENNLNNLAQPSMSQYRCIDEIFAKYLEDIYQECNKEYYEFITKFVILFRECINKLKNDSSGEEFSTKNNADNVPDMCNEFITDFMEGYDYFGLDTMELIEIIQHLCNWLYESKFTTSKLSLVS